MTEENLQNISDNFITREGLQNLKSFQYKGISESIVYNNITSPMIEKYFMPILPLWVAPNTLTLFSFIFNFITFIIILIETGNDFTIPISRLTCLLQAVSHFLYILLDNSDGKQARRTNSSSPLGLIFDHGFDIITVWMVSFNMSHMVMTGNTGIKSINLFFSLFLGTWVTFYEEYVTGTLNLGKINGPDEGNFIIFISAICSFIFGTQIWIQPIFYEYTFTDFMAILLFLGSLQNVFQCIWNVYNFNKSFDEIGKFVYNSINMWVILSFPLFTMYYDNQLFQDGFTLIMLLFSLTFSRINVELLISIVTNQKIVPNFIVSFTHLLYWNILVFLKNIGYSKYRVDLMILLNLINLITFVNFCYRCVIQIKNYLGINVFSIDFKKEKVSRE